MFNLGDGILPFKDILFHVRWQCNYATNNYAMQQIIKALIFNIDESAYSVLR